MTLINLEMPFHTHTARNAVGAADELSPSGNVWAQGGARRTAVNMYTSTLTGVSMAPQALSIAGASLPHNNMPPYLTLNFCIALQGVFPQRP